MDKIKFIMLENDKFSMAINYSDIVAIQNKDKNGVEVMLESNFVNYENKYKILKLDFDYDKIVDNLKDDFNFVKIGNVLINNILSCFSALLSLLRAIKYKVKSKKYMDDNYILYKSNMNSCYAVLSSKTPKQIFQKYYYQI